MDVGGKKEVVKSRYKEMVIFTYSTEHLLKKDKIRFYYALKGRDGKSGIVNETHAEHIGSAVILVDQEFENEWQDFFRLWNIPYEMKKVKVGE